MKKISILLFFLSYSTFARPNRFSQEFINNVTKFLEVMPSPLVLSHNCNKIKNRTQLSIAEKRYQTVFCRDPYHSICSLQTNKLYRKNLESYEKLKGQKVLKKRIKQIFSPRNIKKFKKRYIQLVEKQKISTKLKKEYIKKIEKIVFYDGVTKVETGAIPTYRDMVCGPHNDLINAAAFPLDPDKDKISGGVIICPALLKKMISPQDSIEDAWSKLSMILGHEIGHILYGKTLFWSASVPGDNYNCFNECLVHNRSHKLLIENENGSDGTYHWYNYFSTRSRVMSRLHELGADYWGLSLFAEYLQNLSFKKRLNHLRLTMGFFCDSVDDKEHPSGKYRILISMRNNSLIKKIFNCKKNIPPDDKTCEILPDDDCEDDLKYPFSDDDY